MSKGAFKIDQDLIRELAALLHEKDLSEIEIQQDDVRLRLARVVAAAPAPTALPVAAPVPPPSVAAPPPVKAAADNPGAVKSPMVGTAYRAAEPGASPFVEVGARVRQGQILLIIEAMKTMNQILAPRAGTVSAILFEDSQPVEYGEPLLIID